MEKVAFGVQKLILKWDKIALRLLLRSNAISISAKINDLGCMTLKVTDCSLCFKAYAPWC